MTTPASTERSGFIAIEIVSALAVLGIVGFGSFNLYHFGIAQLRVSTERTVAVRALENEYERLRALPMSELSEIDNEPFQVEMPELETLYEKTTSISVEPYEASPDAQMITLTITWISFGGRTITEKLTTLRAF
ncbi:MAG: hypothetical protein VCB26_13750 [Candidatus Hydrogenedentota bacterium]